MPTLPLAALPEAILANSSFPVNAKFFYPEGEKFDVINRYFVGDDDIVRFFDFTQCKTSDGETYYCRLQELLPGQPVPAPHPPGITPEVIDQSVIDILEGLEILLCRSDTELVACGNKLDGAASGWLWETQKLLDRIIRKLLRCIDKLQIQTANDIEFLWTKLLSVIDYLLQNAEWTLTQLAIKASIIQIGDTIDVLVNINSVDMVGPTNCPTIVLNFSQVMPILTSLVDILTSIRNCMCPTVATQPTKGPTPFKPKDFPVSKWALTADEDGNPPCVFIDKLDPECK